MKEFGLFSIIILTIFQLAYSQKEDNIWVFGYRYTDQPVSNGIYFYFDDSLTIHYKPKPMSFNGSNASICDSLGNLLLLSNGCYIEKGNGIMVPNSDGLNPGWVYDNYCNGPYSFGYPYDNDMMLLPVPGSPSIYNLFHISTYASLQPLVAYGSNLLCTQIDIAADNGQGKILLKNQPLVQDTLHNDGLSAVRHANGRDWWVVVAKQSSNKYYLLLLSPAGIDIQEQNIGEPTTHKAGGQMVFSPDGTKMARFNTSDDLRIFDFDRCTGELSNPVHIPIQDSTEDQASAGLAFSADGHYLYAAEVKRFLQFDMWASDIAASMTRIAEWQTSPDCVNGRSIGFLEMGPDGRIYCRPLSGQRCMHRLARPELPGTSSEFVPFYYRFDFAFDNLPHFPNFRLGPVDGSTCDTLGLDNHPLAGWRYDKTGGLGVDFTSVSWYEPTAWLWDFDDPASGAANFSPERNPAHTFSAPGAYDVCLTVSNAYGSDTKCKTVWVSTVGTGEAEGRDGVVISPNPTTGEVSVSGIGTVLVRVYNPVGQLQLEKNASDDGRISLAGLPAGLYRFQILREGHMLAVRSVVLMPK